MNKILKNISLALIATVAIGFAACDDDEDVKNVLVVNDFESGKFYTVDKTTGTLTEAFTATYDGSDFVNLRAFVYHRGENKFYASTNNNGGSNLFSINPETKEVELIAENTGENNSRSEVNGWYTILALAVAKDDSLFTVSTYDFEEAEEYSNGGFLKFAKDGTASGTGINAIGGICCGMGAFLDEDNNQVVTANGWSQSNGTIDIETFDLETGESLSLVTIEEFEGFEEDFSDNYLTIRTMLRDSDGTIYAIVYDTSSDFSYLVTVDLANEKIKRISTLAENDDAQFTGLAFIPENFTK